MSFYFITREVYLRGVHSRSATPRTSTSQHCDVCPARHENWREDRTADRGQVLKAARLKTNISFIVWMIGRDR